VTKNEFKFVAKQRVIQSTSVLMAIQVGVYVCATFEESEAVMIYLSLLLLVTSCMFAYLVAVTVEDYEEK